MRDCIVTNYFWIIWTKREEPRDTWEMGGGECQRHGPSAKYQILPPLPLLSKFPITAMSILTKTFFYNPAAYLPNIKPTLPSSTLFCHSAIHTSVSSVPSVILNYFLYHQQTFHSATKNVQYLSHLHHIANIDRPNTYHTSPCHP